MSDVRTISESDNGRTVEIAAGEVAEIRLPENPTTGFRWIVASPQPSGCAALARSEYHPPAQSSPGAAGERVWRLRATHSGVCDIELHYMRPWQSAAGAAKRFILHLRVG